MRLPLASSRKITPYLTPPRKDARGQAAGYEILAGPDGQAVRRQLDQLMLFSRFRPQMTFGRPTSGGRVRMVLTFSEIRVRG